MFGKLPLMPHSVTSINESREVQFRTEG